MNDTENKTLFYTFNQFLKNCFSCKVYKVSIDGGFSCPNRDGTKGTNGCIFCDETGSSSRTNDQTTSITEQILNNIKVRKSRYRAKKFIAYFQSFSNTYADVLELKKKFDEAINAHEDIVGLSISTRPDCVDEEKIKLIASYKKKLKYVCIEYGMQSCHDKSLKFINRHETHEDFIKAINLTKKYDLTSCAHVILNLPHESFEDQMKTAETITKLKIEGVKIHLLVALKNTYMETLYNKKLWNSLSYEQYINLACSFLEKIDKKCIIHRVSVSGYPLDIVAPLWMKNKNLNISKDITEEFLKRNTCQGYYI